MYNLMVVEKLAQWQRLKALVLNSVSSPTTRRLYDLALDEFISLVPGVGELGLHQ